MISKQEHRVPVLHADAAGADWIKRGCWDIPARNIEELLEYLYNARITVEQFKTLDVYRAHVKRPGMGWLRAL